MLRRPQTIDLAYDREIYEDLWSSILGLIRDNNLIQFILDLEQKRRVFITLNFTKSQHYYKSLYSGSFIELIELKFLYKIKIKIKKQSNFELLNKKKPAIFGDLS